jgi:HK97 gp10 family phage protein
MGYETKIPEFKKEFDKGNAAFLLAVGSLMVTSMKKRAPVKNGTLRQDIKFEADVQKMLVGAGNTLEYSIYVNKGTGVFVAGGRSTPWVYFDPQSGQYFLTHGQKPQPYIVEGFTQIKGQIGAIYKKVMEQL